MSVREKAMLAGVIALAALSGAFVSREAWGTQDKPAAPGRYQISAWSYGYGYGIGTATSSSSKSEEKHGAYILDTQTGDVWLTQRGANPTHVGTVAK